MIIKSMARKSASFSQLLNYINAPEKVGVALLHNFQHLDDSLLEIAAEFGANASLLPERRNGNVLYHEILSFAHADDSCLTPAVMSDLTRQYLNLRAPYALAYAKAHYDTSCPHVHIVISANNVGERRRLRLSKEQFREIQREMEAYQKDRYPSLKHSFAQERTTNRAIRATRTEQERVRRGEERASQKEQVRKVIATVLAEARSGEDCYHRLLSRGLRLYRRGKSVGVEDMEDCRRYRLQTLGLAETFERLMSTWRKLPERLATLPNRTPGRSRRLDR